MVQWPDLAHRAALSSLLGSQQATRSQRCCLLKNPGPLGPGGHGDLQQEGKQGLIQLQSSPSHFAYCHHCCPSSSAASPAAAVCLIPDLELELLPLCALCQSGSCCQGMKCVSSSSSTSGMWQQLELLLHAQGGGWNCKHLLSHPVPDSAQKEPYGPIRL